VGEAPSGHSGSSWPGTVVGLEDGEDPPATVPGLVRTGIPQGSLGENAPGLTVGPDRRFMVDRVVSL
jgi:hypothetical protein